MPNFLDTPTTGEVIRGLMLTGDAFTPDIDRLKFQLNHIAPIVGRLVIDTPPPGFPPDEIRAEWVGTRLPVRAIKPCDTGTAVLAREAIHELEVNGKKDAAQWWLDYYSTEAELDFHMVDFEGTPEVVANVAFLLFDSCGDVVNPAHENY